MERVCLEIVLFTIVFSSMCWLVSDNEKSVGVAPIVEIVEIAEEIIVEDVVEIGAIVEEVVSLVHVESAVKVGDEELLESRFVEFFGADWNKSKAGKVLGAKALKGRINKLLSGVDETVLGQVMLGLEHIMV